MASTAEATMETTTETESPVEKVHNAIKKAKKMKKDLKKKNVVAKALGGKSRLDPEKKIKVLVDENPKREGTRSYKEFELYKNGMTVGTLLEKGAKIKFRTSALRWDLAHKFIALQ